MKKIILVLMLLLVPAVMAYEVEVLNTEPAPIKAGEFADITLQFVSDVNDDDLTNVQISIKDNNFVRSIGGETGKFSSFPSGRLATRTFTIFVDETLPEGFVDLTVLVQSTQTTLEFDVSVFIEGGDTLPELSIGSVESVPRELLPDTDDNHLKITIQNLGDKDAELLKATLKSNELVKPSYSYSMEDSISSINSGEEGTFEFMVDIDESAQGEIPANLEIRYRTEVSDSYETFTTILPVKIQLIDSPLLKITKVEQIDSFVGGTTENKVLVTIRNDGNEDAEEVRVRVVPDISYPFIFETTTQYVSSKIAPGEEAVIEYVAEVTSEAENKEYAITTKLESLVGEARYTREDVLKINTQVGEGVDKGNVATGVIVIILITASFIGYRTFKRKK